MKCVVKIRKRFVALSSCAVKQATGHCIGLVC